MQSASDGQPLRPSKHAITDIFDEEKRIVLVKYSTRLIFGLTAFGILAFVITGLIGYDLKAAPPKPWDWVGSVDRFPLFRKPVFLFSFFCALILVLQASVLRENALRRYRRPVYTATTVSIVLVSALYLFRDNLGDLLNKVVNFLQRSFGGHDFSALLRGLVTNPWFWLGVYVLVLVVLFGQAALSWRRAAAGKLANQPIDLGTGRPSPLSDEEQADVWDLVAGDLTLRSLLLVPIGLLFWYPLPRFFAHSLGVPIGPDPSVKGSFNLCSVSLPGTCGPFFAFELWWLNLIIAAIILALGVIAVALLVQREAIRLLNVAQINRGQEILNAFLDILLSPFSRRPRSRVGRRVSRGTQASLRPLVWPVLIFFGVVGAAGMADFIQAAEQCPRFYDNVTQATLPARCQASGGLPDSIVGHALGHIWTSGLPVLGFAILAVGGTVLAFAVLFGRWRVAGNIFSFLKWMALSNALTVGLLLLALTLLNWAALFLAFLIRLSVAQIPSSSYGLGDWLGLTNPYRQHPFYPGMFALALYAALLIAGVALSVSSRSNRAGG